jgi:hypothetical protein
LASTGCVLLNDGTAFISNAGLDAYIQNHVRFSNKNMNTAERERERERAIDRQTDRQTLCIQNLFFAGFSFSIYAKNLKRATMEITMKRSSLGR